MRVFDFRLTFMLTLEISPLDNLKRLQKNKIALNSSSTHSRVSASFKIPYCKVYNRMGKQR